MLCLEYAGFYNYQIMLKVVVYSIKIKLEFFVLQILSNSVQGANSVSKVRKIAPVMSNQIEKSSLSN